MHHHVIEVLALVAAGVSLPPATPRNDVGSIFDSKPGNAEARATVPPSAETTGSIAQHSKLEQA